MYWLIAITHISKLIKADSVIYFFKCIDIFPEENMIPPGCVAAIPMVPCD